MSSRVSQPLSSGGFCYNAGEDGTDCWEEETSTSVGAAMVAATLKLTSILGPFTGQLPTIYRDVSSCDIVQQQHWGRFPFLWQTRQRPQCNSLVISTVNETGLLLVTRAAFFKKKCSKMIYGKIGKMFSFKIISNFLFWRWNDWIWLLIWSCPSMRYDKNNCKKKRLRGDISNGGLGGHNAPLFTVYRNNK